jgi:hypothetical protein
LQVQQRKALLQAGLLLFLRQQVEQLGQDLALGDLVPETIAQDLRQRRRAAG